jgi:hypothetical protein
LYWFEIGQSIRCGLLCETRWGGKDERNSELRRSLSWEREVAISLTSLLLCESANLLLLKGSTIPSMFGRIQTTFIDPRSLRHVFQGDTKDATERTFVNNAAQQNSGEKTERFHVLKLPSSLPKEVPTSFVPSSCDYRGSPIPPLHQEGVCSSFDRTVTP